MATINEKVRIIVAFGDLSGFTGFCDDITHDAVEYDPFMAAYDALIDETAKRTGYKFTDTGDGFMCILDLVPGHNCSKASEFLHNLWELLKRIQRMIDKKEPPKPSGFRIAVTSGYVKRTVRENGTVVSRGKYINMAHNLLDIARGKGLVCDDSFKRLISEKQIKRENLQFFAVKGWKRLWVVKVCRA